MAEICDFFNNDGTTTQDRISDLQNSFANGNLNASQDEVSAAVNAWFNDQPYSPCATSESDDGSNGGGGGQPQPESELTIANLTVDGGIESVSVSYTVSNSIVTSPGESLSATVGTTAEGAPQDARTVSLSPGESTTESLTFPAAPGSQTVCVFIE